MLGGTQSLHTNGRDEALALPTEDAARIALRTQQIIAHESGVANTVDPFGGSYHVEKLTNEIEDGARELLTRIEAAGGTLAAIEAGFIQRQIQEAAYKAQLAIDTGDGRRRRRQSVRHRRAVDAWRCSGSTRQLEARQVQRVRAGARGAQRPARWRRGARRGASGGRAAPTTSCRRSSPPSRRRPRVGEIADTLRGVFGEYREVSARLESSDADGSWPADAALGQNLTTVFDVAAGRRAAVNDVSFEIRKGETLGLVGESGSGKSVTAFSIMRLVQPPGGSPAAGCCSRAAICWRSREREMRQVRGAGIGFVFQEPMAALNPGDARRRAHRRGADRPRPGLASATRGRAPSICCAR